MKSLIALSFFAISLMAQDMQVYYNYDKAIDVAAKEKKDVVMILKTQYCPWCKKLVNETLADKNVASYVEKNYIVAIIDRDKDEFPAYFNSKIVPVTYIVDPLTSKESEMIIGYVTPERFLKVLQK
jgi:thioredoxin-related protein